MNRSVQLYIEGQRIELFQDEAIQVTSSIQNVQDLSKTYTDFSQGFTVPASSHNNAIFEHWYQSDVNATNDPNIRRDAYIEIDLTTFRKGKIQLEGAVITNGKPSAYNITFFGEGVTLKDLFGEDLLSDLDYTPYTHDYTSDEVQFRIEDATDYYDVKYPLVTSNRIWEYNSIPANVPLPNWLVSTLTANDINTTSGAIDKDELFPALRVTKVLEAIEAKYGITFKGTFLTDERLTKLFLWFKGKETLITSSVQEDVDFTSVSPTYTTYDLSGYVNTATNEIQVQFIDNEIIRHVITLNVNSVTSTSVYYVDIYQNGNLINTISSSGIDSIVLANIYSVSGLDVTYNFKIRGDGSNTLGIALTYGVDYILSGVLETDFVDITASNVSISTNVNLSANAPQMKVQDFVKGLMLMFNMTIYSIKDNEYWLEPLDDWYSKGAVIDITSFTDVTSIEHNRMPLYKKIGFQFQESESFMNKNFSQTYNRNYGDTMYQYNYDGGEFVIDVPFENLLGQKFTGTDLQVGYSLNTSFAPYVPKPILFYQYDNQSATFKFKDDGGGTNTITTYTPFGQDLLYNGNDVTLNFAPETSSLLLEAIQVTGFSQYYFSYLYNLYNLKQRLVNVKTNLPTSLVTGLQLNDRLVIRDKRYIINEMKTNLSTGDVDLQLILDFRPVINSTQTTPVVSPNGGDVLIPVILDNNATQIGLSSSISDVSFSHSIVYEERMVTVTIGASNVEFTMITESGDILASERAEQITTEGEESRLIDVSLTSTYPDGSTSRRTIYIIQQ